MWLQPRLRLGWRVVLQAARKVSAAVHALRAVLRAPARPNAVITVRNPANILNYSPAMPYS